MILHIFNDQKKFSMGYFQMLSDNGIALQNMQLIHYGKKDSFFSELGLKTVFISDFFNPFSNLKLLKAVFAADKIIVHSLASPYLLLLISFFPSVAAKVNWVIWGKDLYFYQMLRKPRFYHKIYERLRRKAIRAIPKICSIFKEDYELACQWYDVKAANIEMITLYPYALNIAAREKCDDVKTDGAKTILLGNSGSKTNNHIQVLQKMLCCKDDIKKIICPLSYGGNKKYVQSVIECGKELFGDKFIPLCDFVPKEQYFEMLDGVDVGVFNYSRQEGLGNIWSLMMSGKTIYMKHETSTTRFFKRNNIIVQDIEMFNKKKIELLPKEVIHRNMELLRPLIDVDMSIKKWKEVL